MLNCFGKCISTFLHCTPKTNKHIQMSNTKQLIFYTAAWKYNTSRQVKSTGIHEALNVCPCKYILNFNINECKQLFRTCALYIFNKTFQSIKNYNIYKLDYSFVLFGRKFDKSTFKNKSKSNTNSKKK